MVVYCQGSSAEMTAVTDIPGAAPSPAPSRVKLDEPLHMDGSINAPL